MNVRRAVAPVVCLLVAVGSSFAQHRVDLSGTYERVYAIVPMIGSGTWDDPIRPMFAPVPQQKVPGDRSGIIAFNHVQSDDGKFALIEIVAANKKELAPIAAQIKSQLTAVPGLSPGSQVFDRGSSSASSVQDAFRLLKKDFDISKFRVVVP